MSDSCKSCYPDSNNNSGGGSSTYSKSGFTGATPPLPPRKVQVTAKILFGSVSAIASMRSHERYKVLVTVAAIAVLTPYRGCSCWSFYNEPDSPYVPNFVPSRAKPSDSVFNQKTVLGRNLADKFETKDAIDDEIKSEKNEVFTTESSTFLDRSTTPAQLEISSSIPPSENESTAQDVLTKLQNLTPEQKTLLEEVTKYGLDQMRELYLLTEPNLYKEGIFLQPDSPGSYLAAFNAQSETAKNYSLYGYAALRASHKLKAELERSESRHESASNLTRAFPTISLHDTSLHDDCPLSRDLRCSSASRVFRSADGSCNNERRPWWGSTFQPLKRYLGAHYDDGLESARRSRRGGVLPSARLISTSVHWDQPVNSAAITHLLMQWGQFIDHDMMSSSQSRGFNGSVPRCCDTSPQFLHPDCLPIEVPARDRFYSRVGIRCLEFLRSAPAPRQGCALGGREQMNQVTSFLDGSMIYGTNPLEMDSLRLRRNGMLRYTRQQMRLPLLPQDSQSGFCRSGENFQCFQTGDRRVTEQPGLIAMHTLFLRFHNRVARQLGHINQHWSDERIFQETRKIVGAVIQHITYHEYLPVLLGKDVMEMFSLELLKEGYFKGYKPDLNPAIANSFATAAYRFGHSMVQAFMLRWQPFHDHLIQNVTLHEELFDSGKMHREGAVDGVLVGMTIQSAQARDEHIVEELTNHLFQTQRFPAGLDLAATNIQRGRDHGLPPYNAWRSPCGLRRALDWDELRHVMSLETSNTLRDIYRDIDDIDLFTGGLAEFPVRGGILGSTFACIVAQQFSDLRHSDRFWYELGGQDSSFTPDQLQQIRRVSLARILCDNLDLVDAVQPFVFLTPDTKRNGRLECRSLQLPIFTLTPWQENFSGKWVTAQQETATDSSGNTEPIPEIPLPDVTIDEMARELPRPIPNDLV